MTKNSATRTAEARRLEEARAVLIALQLPIRDVITRVPGGVPATGLTLPETVDGYRALADELFANLFTENGSNHPRWINHAGTWPAGDVEAVMAADEAMYLWYQALRATQDYVRNAGLLRHVLPSEVQDRVLGRLKVTADELDTALKTGKAPLVTACRILHLVRIVRLGAIHDVSPLVTQAATGAELAEAIHGHTQAYRTGPLWVDVRADLTGGRFHQLMGDDLGGFTIERIELHTANPRIAAYTVDLKRCPGGDCEHASPCEDLGEIAVGDLDEAVMLAAAASAGLPGPVLARVYTIDLDTGDASNEIAAYLDGVELVG